MSLMMAAPRMRLPSMSPAIMVINTGMRSSVLRPSCWMSLTLLRTHWHPASVTAWVAYMVEAHCVVFLTLNDEGDADVWLWVGRARQFGVNSKTQNIFPLTEPDFSGPEEEI